ncbi:MAG: aromatic ring-hydroxylating dioxygenase subunit alpha [Proteobacteria bacterium]|nr:aromatic ring-hydroxylating dioxygenase subunit alpha [Pseudomonadota bacterium]
MIPNQWYPILESKKLRRRPVALTRMGESLALWRDGDGRAVVMRDRCPHRGVALSGGRVRDGQIECPYHGFRYRRDGECSFMPCEGRDAKIPAGMRAHVYQTREAHGLVWLFWSEAFEGALPEIPWFEAAADERRGGGGSAVHWPQNYVRTLETNFDIHHLPFVHKALVLGAGARIDPYQVEVEGNHIRTWGTLRREDRETGIDFRVEFKAPSITLLELSPRLLFVVADCPIDEQNTWRYARYYQDYVTVPGLHGLLSWFALQLDWKLFQVRQDLRVVGTQEPRLPDQERDRLVRADGGTAAYLKLRRKLLAEAGQAPTGLLRSA